MIHQYLEFGSDLHFKNWK